MTRLVDKNSPSVAQLFFTYLFEKFRRELFLELVQVLSDYIYKLTKFEDNSYAQPFMLFQVQERDLRAPVGRYRVS